MTHIDVFFKVNSPRCVGKLTSKVNSRSEYATKILLVVWCKIIEGLVWVLVHSRVVRRGHVGFDPWYRGTSLIRNNAPPGPSCRTFPVLLWWS